MKILITGVNGLVGSACRELFDARGWEVTGIDNNQRSKMFGSEDKSGHGEYLYDIRDQDGIGALFRGTGPFDAVIHAAAQPSHDYATEHIMEDFDINARGTVILLEATRKYSPKAVFVHVSTDKVYGENMYPKEYGFQEEETRYIPHLYHTKYYKGFDESLGLDFAGDRSFFGCSKAAADMYAQQYAARGLTVGIFRPGCITGKNHAGSRWHGFLAYLAQCIKEGKPYTIHGNGKQVRDQIHASDLAAAFYSFIQSPKAGAVYNIGGGPDRSVSVLEAIELIQKELGIDTWPQEAQPALFTSGPERLGDRRWDVHDVSKFRSDYPEWDYKYSLADIIKDLV